MKHLLPSTLAIAALLSASLNLRADAAGDASTDTKACSGEACTAPSTAAAAICPVDCDKPCCANAAAKLTKVQYDVKDLACAACENKVKQVLASLDGVHQASACSQEKQVKVAYEANKVKEKQLLAAIRKAGFNVSAETVELKVDGMKCDVCSGAVSKALADLRGVMQQDVCHETGKALVKFDPNALSREKVLAAIDGAGFKASQ